MMESSVTYIITTYNRGKFLAQHVKEQLLSGFFDTEKIKFDVIIVDDGSPDGAFEGVKALCKGKIGIPLRYMCLNRREKDKNYFYSDSFLNNLGIMISTSEFVYLAAEDCYICSSSIFQRLLKLPADKYICPNQFRFTADMKDKMAYEYCSKNWKDPMKCYEHFKERCKGKISTHGGMSPSFGSGCYLRHNRVTFVGTGLFGIARKTFINMGGIPPVKAGYGTDMFLRKALIENNITLDEELNSDLFVMHFPIRYSTPFCPKPPGLNIYPESHYEKIEGVAVVNNKLLDIHNLIL